jgi:hypothetical protein
MLVLFCCFTHMEGHTAYMQPCLFPKVLYNYIHTLLLHNNDSLYYCIFFSQLVHSLIKVYRGLCTYWHSKYSILTYCCPSSIESLTSLQELCTAVSLKMTSDSCQRNTAIPYIRGLYKMMPLYARKDGTLC